MHSFEVSNVKLRAKLPLGKKESLSRHKNVSLFWPRTQQLVGTHGKMYFSFFRLAREIQLYKGAEKRKRWPCLSLPTFPCWLLSKILQIRSLEYKTFYHSTLVLCHLCKTGKIKDKKTQDSQVIRFFMSTIQCQAFTKQASHQTYLQSQKCFHICSTLRRKNTNHCESSFHSLSQLPVGSSNMVHQLERRRGGPPSAPSSTCRPPTNPQHQHQHRQQQHQHCWQFKLGPPTEGPPYTISSTCRPHDHTTTCRSCPTTTCPSTKDYLPVNVPLGLLVTDSLTDSLLLKTSHILRHLEF